MLQPTVPDSPTLLQLWSEFIEKSILICEDESPTGSNAIVPVSDKRLLLPLKVLVAIVNDRVMEVFPSIKVTLPDAPQDRLFVS